MVAAKCGARVILSDRAETPPCLENCRRSCDANGLGGVAVLGLTWGEVSPDLVLLPELDIILGSDVFYEPRGQFLYRHTDQTMYGPKYVDWGEWESYRPGRVKSQIFH